MLAYLAGELGADELVALERHLDHCGACRRVVAVVGAHVQSMGKNDALGTSGFSAKADTGALLRSLRIVDELDYVVERELARGGMGRILLASDRQGRPVALKVLLDKGARATRRFVREMQVTASLQHPSIITLYEAGRWPSGECFFAMKLVKGRTLRAELAALPALKDRLALVPRLIAATDALAYAHDQGVIHRDLKPSNILIGAFGETVVIDWGLAKARGVPSVAEDEPSMSPTRDSGGDDTTELGTPIGTPAYMAPEQARGDEVDERADVYGLGALLYHALSGRAPYSGFSARDVLSRVLEGPPTPLAEQMPELPTDLVTIVQKAMMPDAGARYATAKDMAEDLRRFAAGQLVLAHAYPVSTLVRRWVRRNRAAVSVAAGLLAIGAVAAWASLDRIVDERNRAETERMVAMTHHTAAEDLVKFLITEFRDRVSRADRIDLVDGLGERVSRYYGEIEGSGMAMNASTLVNRAVTLQALGGIELERRRLSSARPLLERAIEFFEQADVGSATPAPQLTQHGKAWQVLGTLEYLEGHADAAVQAHERAVALADRSAARDPEYLPGHLLGALNLGRISDTLQMRKGDLQGSFDACSRAVARLVPLLGKFRAERDLRRRLASLEQTLSDRHLALGNLDEAVASIKRSSALYAELVGANLNDLVTARYAYTFVFLGAAELARGNLDAALAAIRETVQRYERIVKEDPTNVASEEDLGVGYAYQCDFERRASRLENAESACRKALTIFRRHQNSDGASKKTASMLVMVLTNLGRVEQAAGRPSAARGTLDEAVGIARGLTQSDPQSGKWREDLTTALSWLVDSELKLGQLGVAVEHAREALALAETLASESPSNTDVQSALGRIRLLAGSTALAAGRARVAADFDEAAAETFEQLLQRSPRMVDFRIGLAFAKAHWARSLEATPGASADEIEHLRSAARDTVTSLRRAGQLFAEDAARWDSIAR